MDFPEKKSDNPIFEWMKNPLNEKLLIILRGIPSSGKSFRANELSSGDSSIVFSADKFFGTTPEEYVANWRKEKLYTAHTWCQNSTRKAMQNQLPLVIVDNTNTRLAEMMPYFSMAVQYCYKLKIEEPTSPWWVNDIAPYLSDKVLYKEQLDKAAQFLYEKNKETHCVPLESISKMLYRYRPNITFDDLANTYKPGN